MPAPRQDAIRRSEPGSNEVSNFLRVYLSQLKLRLQEVMICTAEVACVLRCLSKRGLYQCQPSAGASLPALPTSRKAQDVGRCARHLQKPLDDIERDGLLHAIVCSGLQLPHTPQQPLVDCDRIRLRDPDAWSVAHSDIVAMPTVINIPMSHSVSVGKDRSGEDRRAFSARRGYIWQG